MFSVAVRLSQLLSGCYASPRGSVRLLSKCLVPPRVVSYLGACGDPVIAFSHRLSILS